MVGSSAKDEKLSLSHSKSNTTCLYTEKTTKKQEVDQKKRRKGEKRGSRSET
jgi:hypothetical protein